MSNSLLVALSVMSIVFVCLISLTLLLKLQSFIFGYIKNNKKGQQIKGEVTTNIDSAINNIEKSNGELKLIGVDEKTTALIMAILSDELKIPLYELQFKSIKLINS